MQRVVLLADAGAIGLTRIHRIQSNIIVFLFSVRCRRLYRTAALTGYLKHLPAQ